MNEISKFAWVHPKCAFLYEKLYCALGPTKDQNMLIIKCVCSGALVLLYIICEECFRINFYGVKFLFQFFAFSFYKNR